jgi:hypothetical protein
MLKGPFDLEAFNYISYQFLALAISLGITGNNTKLFLRGVVIYLSNVEFNMKLKYMLVVKTIVI